MNPLDQFRDAMLRRDLVPPDPIEADGKLHRCDAKGRKRQRDGAYVLHLDGVPAGGLQNHADGLGWDGWRADMGRALTTEEELAHRRKVETQRREREAYEERCREGAAVEARLIVSQSKAGAPEHAYIVRKGIKSCGLRVHRGDLVIPMRDADGELRSVQTIRPDGTKRFLPYGQKRGCYFTIGKPQGVICITEGLATAASVHEATGHAVAVAFDCSNLLPVATALRAKYPDTIIIMCADDDYRTVGNPGLTKAQEAAAAVDGAVAVPDFGDERPDGATDFNDLHQIQNLDAVRRCIEGAQNAPKVLKAPNMEAEHLRHLREHLHPEASEEQPAEQDVIRLLRASDLRPEAITWLWEYWLAQGKLHILAGPPGSGKTTIAVACIATVTIGGRWPDGSRCGEPGNVLFWSGEDDPTDTLLPRLIAAGADPSRVYFVTGARIGNEVLPFDPARDMLQLAAQAERIGNVRLLVVDPVVSAVMGDSHKNTEVRRALQPLVDLAANLNAALLGISHFSKGTGGRDPTERVTGSVAFGAVARVVMVAVKVKDEDGSDRRILARSKSNIGPDDGGFEYELEQIELDAHPGITASRVLWGDPVAGTARDLLAEPEDDGEHGARESAQDWLCELLSDCPVPAKQVQADAKGAGYSWSTVRRAADGLDVVRKKAGMEGGWFWSLPNMLTKTPKTLTPEREPLQHLRGDLSTFGDSTDAADEVTV